MLQLLSRLWEHTCNMSTVADRQDFYVLHRETLTITTTNVGCVCVFLKIMRINASGRANTHSTLQSQKDRKLRSI